MAPSGTRTMAQVDAAFAGWIANAHNDTTGHITLEHELYQNTVSAAIANLPSLQATWKTMPVSACMNDPHPYKEKNITLATMNGTVAGVGSTTTTTLAASTPTGSAAGSHPSAGATGGKTGTNSGAAKNGLATATATLLVALAAVVALF